MVSASSVRITGPLVPYRDGLWLELQGQGYSPLSSRNLLRLMAHLSRWLVEQGVTPAELSSLHVQSFARHRKRSGYTCWCSPRGLNPILQYLRRIGVVTSVDPVPDRATPLDSLLDEYEEYLRRERALDPKTVHRHRGFARSFLVSQLDGEKLALQRINVSEITSYVISQVHSSSIGVAKLRVSGLRSLLRFLHVRGDLDASWADAVPAVAHRRLVGLPRALSPDHARRLLDRCDRRRHVGRRDFAILLAMLRLGLRAGEVAALRLDDIDWIRGELVIRGKPRREDRLPLPKDVGEALASYLRRSRPRSTFRQVFLLVRAPYSNLTRGGIAMVVKKAGQRIGLDSICPHQLRHTAATQMLRQGASLSEIGQVLRHRRIDTTALYAKVDRDRLQDLALPWPGQTP